MRTGHVKVEQQKIGADVRLDRAEHRGHRIGLDEAHTLLEATDGGL